LIVSPSGKNESSLKIVAPAIDSEGGDVVRFFMYVCDYEKVRSAIIIS